MHDITDIIESLLFVADEPLSLDKLKSVLETVEAKEIKAAMQVLADRYESRGGGFSLYEVAGGWQLRSRPEYNPWIKRLLQPSPQRLSKPALETLAIVAYNQPIIRADIEHIRGVDCGGVLRQLMERKLIAVQRFDPRPNPNPIRRCLGGSRISALHLQPSLQSARRRPE